MPFVVFIAAPELNTLRAMHKAVVDAGLTTKVLTVRPEKLPGLAFLPQLGKLNDLHVRVLFGRHRKMIWRRRWTRAPGSAAPTATTLTWPSSTTTSTRLSTRCRTQSPDYWWSRSGSQSAGSTEDKSDLWPLKTTTTEVGFNTSPLWRWLSHKNCITKLSHLEGSGRSSLAHYATLDAQEVYLFIGTEILRLQCLLYALDANVAFVVL